MGRIKLERHVCFHNCCSLVKYLAQGGKFLPISMQSLLRIWSKGSCCKKGRKLQKQKVEGNNVVEGDMFEAATVEESEAEASRVEGGQVESRKEGNVHFRRTKVKKAKLMMLILAKLRRPKRWQRGTSETSSVW